MFSPSGKKRYIIWWFVGLLLLFVGSGLVTYTIHNIQASQRVVGARAGTRHSPYTSSTVRSISTCRMRICDPPSVFNTNGTPNVIDTWNNIHAFLTFDYKIADPSSLGSRYDYEWGTGVSSLTLLHTVNPSMFLSYYLPFHRDNGTFTDSHASHSLHYWQSVHPDWILYKCDRITPAYEYNDSNVPFDFTNPEVIAWQMQSYGVPASTAGYDALAADNVDLGNWFGACGFYRQGQWVQRYSGKADDPQWVADVIDWLRQMQTALHHLPRPIALIPNLAFGKLAFSDPRLQQLVSNVDGILDEDGFTRSAQGYITNDNWLNRVKFMLSVQAQQKPYYSINQMQTVDRFGIQWALASYLMAKEHSAALFISTYQGFGVDAWHDEYTAPIGSPTAEMYRSQNVYWRNYTNGMAIVNPSATATYKVTLGGTLLDLYGNSVGPTVTLLPHSGLVLLKHS